jgi:hypothetical protein
MERLACETTWRFRLVRHDIDEDSLQKIYARASIHAANVMKHLSEFQFRLRSQSQSSRSMVEPA